jgi:hypothetical protein
LTAWQKQPTSNRRSPSESRPDLAASVADQLSATIIPAIQGSGGLLRSTGRIDFLETALEASPAYVGVLTHDRPT